MGPRLFRILIVLAGVMGADGVMLAAASAHLPDAARLASASSMLLFHAAAVLATVGLAERGVIHTGIGILAATVLGNHAGCSPVLMIDRGNGRL